MNAIIWNMYHLFDVFLCTFVLWFPVIVNISIYPMSMHFFPIWLTRYSPLSVYSDIFSILGTIFKINRNTNRKVIATVI